MSRFAQTYEDPSYEYVGEPEDIMEYLNNEIDGGPTLAKIVDGWVRNTVAEKQQETYSPFGTSNS